MPQKEISNDHNRNNRKERLYITMNKNFLSLFLEKTIHVIDKKMVISLTTSFSLTTTASSPPPTFYFTSLYYKCCSIYSIYQCALVKHICLTLTAVLEALGWFHTAVLQGW